jgi:hypothetical protein
VGGGGRRMRVGRRDEWTKRGGEVVAEGYATYIRVGCWECAGGSFWDGG